MDYSINLRNSKIWLIQLYFFSVMTCRGDYPRIEFTVPSRDALYRQQQQDVAAWYSKNDHSPQLTIYRYKPREKEDLFSMAAAFNLPYESIATLNAWESPEMISSSESVLVPNIPGLFIPSKPYSNREKQMQRVRIEKKGELIRVDLGKNRSVSLIFYSGEKFTGRERIDFLSKKFSSPLENRYITSHYGYRRYYLTNRMQFHTGIDLRASIGTPVLASRSGTVIAMGILENFGNYIIIKHAKGFETFYSHLEKPFASIKQKVLQGQAIATSGNSGVSTGPHLHFEIRHLGIPVDPMSLIAF